MFAITPFESDLLKSKTALCNLSCKYDLSVRGTLCPFKYRPYQYLRIDVVGDRDMWSAGWDWR